jgi:hypothetical protein
MIGSAVADEQGNILYLSEVEVRNDIATTMKARARYRRNRRNRKTRYRKARWLNRRNAIKSGRFSPTMRSKIDAHLREIRFAQSLLPITSMVLETATFDPHALKNPEVVRKKWLYQKGINYGFANTKAYVLTRDGYTCQHCQGNQRINGSKCTTSFLEVRTGAMRKPICSPSAKPATIVSMRESSRSNTLARKRERYDTLRR